MSGRIKDIVRFHEQIQTDLGVPQTGVTTQAEQTRVEEQLQAMIDSLTVSRRRFRLRSKGGGGGGGVEAE